MTLLVSLGYIDKAEELFNKMKIFVKIILHKKFQKTILQKEFESNHPEIYDLYSHIDDFDSKKIG